MRTALPDNRVRFTEGSAIEGCACEDTHCPGTVTGVIAEAAYVGIGCVVIGPAIVDKVPARRLIEILRKDGMTGAIARVEVRHGNSRIAGANLDLLLRGVELIMRRILVPVPCVRTW